ncbi:hypothetical protein [Microbacterium sp.]|uniref:hypothetical protein n=1 Tax=Microbacterium sp. TaxID=51671 RepID=UPI0026263A78|nr:hypothetical protein [Microbacterium sp.]
MTQALRTFGRILASHWIALAAWYLGGEALHQVLVQVAGFVGGYTSLGGLLLLPLAVAARLVSYIAMYLTVRSALAHAAHPAGGGAREFLAATLAAILPFSAFYAAWGMLAADQNEFFNIAAGIALAETNYEYGALGDRGGLISVGVLPVAVLVIALALRTLHARYSERLPAWTFVVAAYTELLWTFMLFTLVGQWWADVREWLAGRAVTAWLNDIGDWFAGNIVPVAFVWEGALWLVGLLAAVIVVPAGWLAVAGVIYGTTFDTTPPALRRSRAALTGTTAKLVRVLLRRFEDLWAAVSVIWRGGPLLIGAFVLAYALWQLATQAGTRGLLELIGGHDSSFWSAYLPMILVAVAAVAEPVGVAVVATAYDAVIARPEAGLDTEPSGLDDEADHAVVEIGDGEGERAGRVIRQEEDSEDVVGE